jgi:hypothetical protein
LAKNNPTAEIEARCGSVFVVVRAEF